MTTDWGVCASVLPFICLEGARYCCWIRVGYILARQGGALVIVRRLLLCPNGRGARFYEKQFGLGSSTASSIARHCVSQINYLTEAQTNNLAQTNDEKHNLAENNRPFPPTVS